MKEELNMDKSFREKLDGFSAPPPSFVWDNIQGKMAAVKRKKRMFLAGWISAAAVVVLAFIAGWYFNESVDIIEPQLAENKIVQQENNDRENTIINNSEINTIVDAETENEIIEPTEVDEFIIQEINEKPAVYKNAGITNTENTDTETLKRAQSEIKLLNRIYAFFESDFSETQLKKITPRKPGNNISEIEKELIAANVSNLNEAAKADNVWKMGVHLAPAYSSHQAEHTESYSQNMTYAGTNGNANVGGGFSVQYKTNKKWSFESGLYYAKSGQNSENSLQLFALNDSYDYAVSAPEKSFIGNAVNVTNGNMLLNSTAGVIEMSGTPKGAEVAADFETSRTEFSNTLLSNGEFSQVFDFIEIPLYLRYSVVDSKIGVEIMGGVNAGLVVGNNAFIDNEFGLQNIGKTQEISSVNLSGTLGLGVNYDLGKHLSLALEPRINYYLNSINRNPDVDFRPYRLGVYTGLYYEF